jgi:hypothetical protein
MQIAVQETRLSSFQILPALKAARNDKIREVTMTTASSIRNSSHEMTAKEYGDLSRRELLVLKEILLTAPAPNAAHSMCKTGQ